MAREKKPVHRVQMTEGKRNIIHQLLEEYDIQPSKISIDLRHPRVLFPMLRTRYCRRSKTGIAKHIEWKRPLNEVCPILYIDAIHYSVRDNGVIQKLVSYVISKLYETMEGQRGCHFPDFQVFCNHQASDLYNQRD